MTEAATVFWFPIEMLKPIPGATIWHGKDRKFESVENAVMFVMETLSVDDRRTAMIQTDQSSIHPPDIQAIYEGYEKQERVTLRGFRSAFGSTPMLLLACRCR